MMFMNGSICIAVMLGVSTMVSAAAADTAVNRPAPVPDDCRALQDDDARLRCYDDRAGQPGSRDDTAPALTHRMEKERDLARRAFAIVPNRPNYILFSYMHEPNVAPFMASDPQTDFQHQELKFQISFAVPLWNRMFGDNGDLWFGYTQLSFWQAFNWARSAPFRETDYEPEFGLSFQAHASLLGLEHQRLSLGVAHQSNGQGDPLSRSWNRIWVMSELERGNFALSLKPWMRIPEAAASDNNPDIADYMGRIELRAAYKREDAVLSLVWRNSLRTGDNHSGYELDWSLPFSKRIKGLVQFYNGYGESLIDYNVWTRRFGIGVLVEDWL
jgi:phospholipase A1